jgi:hypothetical protein
MAITEGPRSNAGRYFTIYLVILGIAALQFVVAYSSISASQRPGLPFCSSCT